MAEDVFNQKDRDQDVALLRLETLVARLDEWRIQHYHAHGAEEKHRQMLADILNNIRLEAKAANDLRLEGMNEFRRQLDKQAGSFVTTDKYETQSRAGADAIAAIGKEVDRRLNLVEGHQANSDGRTAAYAFMFALVPTAVAIVAVIITITQ